MEFSTKSGSVEKQRTACLVIGVYEPRKLTHIGEQIDNISDNYIGNLLRRGDMEGKLGQILLLHHVPNTLADRVLFVGCGKERELTETQYQTIVKKVITTLNETGSMDAICYLTDLKVKGRDTYWKIRFAVETAHQSLYTFDQFKSQKDEARRPLRRFVFNVSSRRELAIGDTAIKDGNAIAAGCAETMDLANTPGNICTPHYLSQRALEFAKEFATIKTTIVSQDELEEMGAGAFIAVAKGSDNPGNLTIMEYQGGPKDEKPIVLVGKGITFDTGGISLKPGEGMDEMKYDMGGAASVFGTMRAVAQMQLPLNLVAIIATAENMPSGKASRPGDIVTSLSGQTIEILNTDAEGRLVLCDALTYAERYNPDVVIDIATLTGAVIIALGHEASGLYSNHNPLGHELMSASDKANDRAWRMPLWDEYADQLKSNFADFSNLGGRPAGSITAAIFLSKFAKKFQWAHLDIAGTAWRSGKAKGATGRPVPLLSQFLMDKVNKNGNA
ncbi:MAG: leucyl aminopeptidase [Gammaproteobacteria bacterium CG22_combo_CG10-13_8_21_14_all_40_8]|nr:MAG: leucyl aminopeptidase [Gammaproteobacteria bacterium CG22_combo_CG10-13_8_21_14_all_40_8]